ncbi:hypothetical protein [Mycobacteroides abscessus]|uniref:hypothetical protein n=1 Tax=Mycobacteroides abscessus TaxID=36809 RepID=UPI0009A630C1|nr:hypothetical protein [Mycobacteroides abscessus]MBN7456688.1 hypothetical protein [Mycobacteroides abscessus subsp. abscessus]SLC72910.1 Uncharacterised protein [Mycobacteroides abscessus subsp. massiliense]SLJ50913.1 Uncharacterised protein [Mycobacteroides abscessus subsp. abscessus]
MRAGKVWNDVDTVNVEDRYLGQRWRPPGMTALVLVVVLTGLMCIVIWKPLAIVIGVVVAHRIIRLNGMVNRFDPRGKLSEIEQLRLALQTTLRPTYKNY